MPKGFLVLPLRTLISRSHVGRRSLIGALAISLFTGLIAAGSVTSPVQAKAAKSDAAKTYAKNYIDHKYGWGTKQYNCLVKVWEYESHWNYKSSGAGGKYLGIPQMNRGFIKHSGYSIKQYKSSYQIQVRVGLKYIKSRYGTACGARAHIKRTGWY